MLLQEFSFGIEHCPGRTNELPDALSLQPQGETDESIEGTEKLLPPSDGQITVRMTPALHLVNASPMIEDLTSMQHQDQRISEIIRKLAPDEAREYCIKDDLLWQRSSEGEWI